MAMDPLRTSDVAGEGTSELDKVNVVQERVFKLERDGTIQVVTGVGAAIAEVLFDGDLAEFHARDNGRVELTELSHDLASREIHLSRAMLERAVLLHEQSTHFGGYDRWPSLLVGHFRAVLGLPWLDQEQLLSDAQQQQMSTRELLAVAWRVRGAQEPHTEPWESTHKVLKQMAHVLGHPGVFGWLGDLGVAHETVETMREMATGLTSRVLELVDQLDEHNPLNVIVGRDVEPAEEMPEAEEATSEMPAPKKPRAKPVGARAKVQPKAAPKAAAKPAKAMKPGKKGPAKKGRGARR